MLTRSSSASASYAAAFILLAAIVPEVKFVNEFSETTLYEKIFSLIMIGLAVFAAFAFWNGAKGLQTVGCLALACQQIGCFLNFLPSETLNDPILLFGEGSFLVFFILTMLAFLIRRARPFRFLIILFALLPLAAIFPFAYRGMNGAFTWTLPAMTKVPWLDCLELLVLPLLRYFAPMVALLCVASMAIRPSAGKAARVFWRIGQVGAALWYCSLIVVMLVLVLYTQLTTLLSTAWLENIWGIANIAMLVGFVLLPIRYILIAAEQSSRALSLSQEQPAPPAPETLTDAKRAEQLKNLEQYYTDGIISKEIYAEKVARLMSESTEEDRF